MSDSAQASDSSVRLVIFDLGRVLIRICNNWPQACQRAGVEVDLNRADPDALRLLDDLTRRYDVGKIDTQSFNEQAAQALALTPAEVHRISQSYLIERYDGVTELIDELAAVGVAMACLSNTNEDHWRLMNDPALPTGLPLDRLTHRFASHIAQLRKPNPEIYRHVERHTGFAPESILFFDDLKENIAAAIELGWDARHVDPKLENPIPFVRKTLAERRVLRARQ